MLSEEKTGRPAAGRHRVFTFLPILSFKLSLLRHFDVRLRNLNKSPGIPYEKRGEKKTMMRFLVLMLLHRAQSNLVLLFCSFVARGIQMGSESKRPRLDTSQHISLSVSPSSSSSPAPSPSTLASRRSQRMRRGRGEKEISVSSDQTLLDLKREVSCACHCFPDKRRC